MNGRRSAFDDRSEMTGSGEHLHRRSHRPEAQCPIRLGEPCTLCVPGATGPQNCGLVALVMTDPELHARLAEIRRTGTHC